MNVTFLFSRLVI